MRYTYNIRRHFDAAHYLPDYDGKCANMHGHRWVVDVEIVFKVDVLPPTGMLVDFGAVKAVVDKFDHTVLNEHMGMPTAEMVAGLIHVGIMNAIDRNPHHDSLGNIIVTVWESPECSVTVEA